MRLRALLVGGIMLIAGVSLYSQPQHAPGVAAAGNGTVFSIDLDPSGNTAASLGAPDDCASVDPGGLVTLDVTAEGIAALSSDMASGGITGFAYSLNFAPDISVVQAQHNFLLLANGGSIADFSEPLPDLVSPWNVRVADTGHASPEEGSGVLTRVTVAVGAGGVFASQFLI